MTDSATFLEAIPLAALTVTLDGRIAGANAAAEALFGPGLVDRNYVTMLRRPPIIACIEETIRDRKPHTTAYRTHSNSQDMSFRVSSRFVGVLGASTEDLILVCFEDRTPLEQANQMRRDFVANVSHELRTPLTAMMGFIETLQGPAKDDPKAQERFLGIMSAEAARMNRLVHDLLSLSRVEELQRQRPKDQVNLGDLLTSTTNALSQLATESSVEIKLSVPEVPILIAADADQLRQVFINLIENGVKYGGSGKLVEVVTQPPDHDASLNCPAVEVQIIDHGPGIASHHVPRLTERFYRADTHRSRDMGGTGLGLAIVKHILTRHRGRLKVNSTLGQGACFSVILPIS